MTTNCPVDLVPLAQSSDTQNPTIFNVNYTNQDFWSMKTRLVDYINQRFGPTGTYLPNTFNDLIESSIAIMLIENWAFLADTLSFKMDQIVNEIFIDTVTEVDNAFRLARLVGFQPTPPIAARSKWSATINAILTTDLTITTPIRLPIPSTGNPTYIELFAADANFQPLFNNPIVISAGQLVNQSIVGLEGQTITEQFTGSGAVGQTVTLSYSSVLFDSVQVQVDGIMWKQVDYFTDSQPRQEYRVEFNSNYQAFVMFGNNQSGLIPSNGSIIVATYRVGGGTAGNIVTGSVTNQQQVTVPGLNYAIPITYQNYSKGEFGYAGDGITEIRRKLTRWVQAQNRAVTGLDYKTISDQFNTPYYGSIGKSTAVLRNYGCAGNIVDLYVLAWDGGELVYAPDELKTALNQRLNDVKMITDFVCIRDGVVILVDVVIDVTLDKFYQKFEAQINANLTNQVNSFFAIGNWDYGQVLKDTDLIKAVSSVQEVYNFQITFVTQDGESSTMISPDFFEIIRPDTITISFVYE